jgi:hypothetical protein
LFKIKSKIPDFERGKTKILTTGICAIFRGLKFESDAEIGQKGELFKGLDKSGGGILNISPNIPIRYGEVG